MTSVLVVSSEPVGPVMAGPAIRAAELARELSRRFDVTLAAPGEEPGPEGPERLRAGLEDHDELLTAISSHDVTVAQRLPPGLLRRASETPTRLVADFYNPITVEVEEAIRHKPPGSRRRLRQATHHAALAHLAAADLVLCASERQVGLWRSLDAGAPLAVVPFGLPADPPRPAQRPVLRGPVVPEDARIVLWNGGIWDWLDAPTAIAALAHLPGDVHLVFMGTTRPAMEERDRHRAGERAREIAKGNPRVHFLDGWVPYERRGAALLESDGVVSAHPDTREARYAFRTRLLDALWARRPIACTRGDVLADLVEERRLGATALPGDERSMALAIAAVLSDPPPSERFEAAAERFRWDRVVAPLGDWIASGERRERTRARRRTVARNVRLQYTPLALETLATDGFVATARRVARNAARIIRRD